jgi:hypothetical protein
MSKKHIHSLSIVLALVMLVASSLACGRDSTGEQTPVVVVATATSEADGAEAEATAQPQATLLPLDPTSTPVPGGCADGMQFVADVSVPDGSVFEPNVPFIKTWRLRNSGSCFWSGYHVVFVDGEPMGTLDQPIPDMPTGEEFDFSIEMTSPGGAGNYTGRWQVQSPGGAALGTLTCVIVVQGNEPPPAEPTVDPGVEPTVDPGVEPTEDPGAEPTVDPGVEPTVEVVAPPANLHVSGWGMQSLTFEWDDAVGEASYILTLGSESVNLPADTTSYVWENPPCGTSVSVTLMARNADGAEVGRAELFGVNTPECQLPNLVIVDAHFEPAEPQAGQTFKARFTIRNDGAAAAGPFDVAWTFHPNLGLEACTWRNDGLAAGQQASGSCQRSSTADPAGYRTTLTLDVGGEVNESEEGDNSANFSLRIRP